MRESFILDNKKLKKYIFLGVILVFIGCSIVAITGEVKLYKQQLNKQATKYEKYIKGKEYEDYYKKEANKRLIVIVLGACVIGLMLFDNVFLAILEPDNFISYIGTKFLSIYVPISTAIMIIYFFNINIFWWLI